MSEDNEWVIRGTEIPVLWVEENGATYTRRAWEMTQTFRDLQVRNMWMRKALKK